MARHPTAKLPVDARRADKRPLVEVPFRRMGNERLTLAPAEAAMRTDELLERDDIVGRGVVAADCDQVARVVEAGHSADAVRGVAAVGRERIPSDDPTLVDEVRAA